MLELRNVEEFVDFKHKRDWLTLTRGNRDLVILLRIYEAAYEFNDTYVHGTFSFRYGDVPTDQKEWRWYRINHSPALDKYSEDVFIAQEEMWDEVLVGEAAIAARIDVWLDILMKYLPLKEIEAIRSTPVDSATYIIRESVQKIIKEQFDLDIDLESLMEDDISLHAKFNMTLEEVTEP